MAWRVDGAEVLEAVASWVVLVAATEALEPDTSTPAAVQTCSHWLLLTSSGIGAAIALAAKKSTKVDRKRILYQESIVEFGIVY